MNQHERRAEREKQIKAALHGEGLYEYMNNRTGELNLPKPAKNGVKRVLPGKTFEGDNYFMQMVRTNDLRLVREIMSPEQERTNMQEQQLIQEQQKLILDQPDQITDKGKVEHVVPNQQPQKMNEQVQQQQPKPEVLLNEDPMEGVEIITD